MNAKSLKAQKTTLKPRFQTQALPIPDEEIFFQVKTESHLKSTWIRVPRKVVSLVWNVGQSTVFNANQKAAVVSALRNMINTQGELILKSARYDEVGKNVADLKIKLATLVFAALTGKAIEAQRRRNSKVLCQASSNNPSQQNGCKA